MKQNEFEASPISDEIMEIIKELCDISGYGITSGIHIGEKGQAAARYIRDKLHEAGLSDAKLEPIKVNNPYPNHYEVKATSESQETDLSEYQSIIVPGLMRGSTQPIENKLNIPTFKGPRYASDIPQILENPIQLSKKLPADKLYLSAQCRNQCGQK